VLPKHSESETSPELGVVRRESVSLLQPSELVVLMRLSTEMLTRRASVIFLRQLLEVSLEIVLLTDHERRSKKILSLDALDPDLEHALLPEVEEVVGEPVSLLLQLQVLELSLARNCLIVPDLVPGLVPNLDPELVLNLGDAEMITAAAHRQTVASVAEARVSAQWQERVWLLLVLELEPELLPMKSVVAAIVAVAATVITTMTMILTKNVQDALRTQEATCMVIHVMPNLVAV